MATSATLRVGLAAHTERTARGCPNSPSLSSSLRIHSVSLGSSSSQLTGSHSRPPSAILLSSRDKRRQSLGIRAATNGTNVSRAEFEPGAQFYKVEAVLRPWRLKFVASGLLKMGIRGVTVTDVRGFGAQGGSRERQAGSEFTDDNFVSKTKLEVVVVREQVEAVIETIIREARTGEIGDGKIFVSPVSDVIRVRTGERGVDAERMAGGRMELLSKT